MFGNSFSSFESNLKINKSKIIESEHAANLDLIFKELQDTK